MLLLAAVEPLNWLLLGSSGRIWVKWWAINRGNPVKTLGSG
jgi:hypothetical protein